MSMSIKIGNATPVLPEWKIGDREPPSHVAWEISSDSLRISEAPRNGYIGNDVSMGGSYLSNAIKKAGLTALFFKGETSLMHGWDEGYRVSGIAGLTVRDADEIERALKSWRAFHPDAAPAAYAGTEMAAEDNEILAKLEWFAFWVRWAVTNCRHPAMQWWE